MSKKEFSIKTKVGQLVWKIEINIPSDGIGDSLYKQGIFIEKLKIVFQSDYKLALSDKFITTLHRKEKGRKKESYETCLDDLSIRVKIKETYWSNGVFASIYSTVEPSDKLIYKLKRDIQSYIVKEYSFLGDITERLNSLIYTPNE